MAVIFFKKTYSHRNCIKRVRADSFNQYLSLQTGIFLREIEIKSEIGDNKNLQKIYPKRVDHFLIKIIHPFSPISLN